MAALSVLDLVMIGEDKNLAQSIKESKQLAQAVEQLGYSRYWVAEHHSMPSIGSSATSLIINEIANTTNTIRVGSGGIMLPNHSPLVIAEQFGTLAALHPGRIDLGLGRAPGTGGPTIHALRRGAPERDFAEDVIELIDYLSNNGRRPVKGVPGSYDIPIWILGSSLYGAGLAAALGMPYSFASHFAPQYLMHALRHYRENFQPSKYLDKPYVMIGISAFIADTDEEANFIASSQRKSVIDLRTGAPKPMSKPIANYYESLNDMQKSILNQVMTYSIVGTKERAKPWFDTVLAQTEADEIIIDSRIHNIDARIKSYEAVADILL